MKRRDESEVFLRRDPATWRRLPHRIKKAVLEGTVDAKRLREAISGAARVSSMPFVRVMDEVWMDPARTGTIEGSAGFRRIRGIDHASVDLSATAVITGNDEILRAILVHEFAHCFFHLSRIIDAHDRGESEVSLPVSENFFEDALHDRDMLPNPSDWFGEEDASRFVHWKDPRLTIIHERMIELDLLNHLPVRTPMNRFSTRVLEPPDDIIAHVRRLREARDGVDG